MDEVKGRKLAIAMGALALLALLGLAGKAFDDDRGKLTPEQRLAIEADCHEHPQALRCR